MSNELINISPIGAFNLSEDSNIVKLKLGMS